ncbi:hypothetical protein ISN45_At02g036620 [Arabidopsis thaliana x Arabidopsis arenosa]|uniref:Agamous-like MADS-box protein n=2 Tax=Arabidopsis TaxID=3701 RepID=F4IKW3_ARATH|nr:agamous-like MADS-box protein [Arabidopsis thaliana]AEC09986.1 agamous-like MADS-box protein [Arabidopsis thaliana]KAG7639332.1 hypothetical protein ISN45_At02g036620 [Arabidopsis thaliana x Arabidopsis arenosa]|eukprot:NP_181678.5 agamous-like MADS-box protein [Arabidopsis thaliana]
MCNYCEFSSNRYGCGSSEQDNVLREKVERLRFLIKRMTGKDDDAHFTELQALESRLKDVSRTVLDQKEKMIKLEEDERKKEAQNESDGTRRGVLVPCNSSEQRQRDDGALLLLKKARFERRYSESLQSEFERLWLVNERMNGRELEGMSSRDLLSLDNQILNALLGLLVQMNRPREEQVAARQREKNNKESTSRLAEQERYSSDNDKDDDTSSPFLKRRRRDLTKDARLLCDFCGLSSSRRYDELRPHKQEHEALSMESEVKRLRLLTRMTGKDLDGLSFEELQVLRNRLDDVLPIVEKHMDKMKLEEAAKKNEAGVDNEGTRRRRVLVPCRFSNRGSGEGQQKQEDGAPPVSRRQREFEKRKAEPMHRELERLWLLKERMNGRELTSMSYMELNILWDQIHHGFHGLHEHLNV